jgi:hypothetical protein
MKTQEDDLLEYDEDAAVAFIINGLPDEAKERIDDDKIEYILDVVYEYYDEKGLIDEDSTEEASIDEEDMLNFIMKCCKKDKMNLTEDDIQLIMDGEYEYGKSLGIYREDEE